MQQAVPHWGLGLWGLEARAQQQRLRPSSLAEAPEIESPARLPQLSEASSAGVAKKQRSNPD